MSSFTKSKLKTAKEAISRKDFAKARDASNEVLSFEPDNYHANVFLGLACIELGEIEQSEQAYRAAIKVSPQQSLAWQGLSRLFERNGQREKYEESLLSLADVYNSSDDAVRCAETLQKYIEQKKRCGIRDQIIDALSLLLPTSRFYALLSSLPLPDHSSPTATSTLSIQSDIHNSLPVIEEIVRLTEKNEEEYIHREVEKRRTRLNASRPEVLKKEVGLEVWKSSNLPALYNEVIGHPNTSDELRRDTEAKLLRYRHNYRCALSSNGEDRQTKLLLGEEIKLMIDGVVLLGIPDELAWAMKLESEDCETLNELDIAFLHRYMHLFPSSHYTKLLRGYFRYSGIPLKEDGNSGDDEENQVMSDTDEPTEAIISAFSSLPGSILAHRMLSEIHLDEEDYQNAILVAEKGLILVKGYEEETVSKLPFTHKALSVTLGTSLVHLFPPKHHARALRVLDDILAQDSDCVMALMGRAYVMQTARKWDSAKELFAKVVTIKSLSDVGSGLEAREEWAWCGVMEADELQEGSTGLKEILEQSLIALADVKDRLDTVDGMESRQARAWWRLGQCQWRLGAREEAYRHYITSLKKWASFAPAFTALGIYYLEHASPPDTARASKCFQKAVELDPREAEAARRLAHGFAEEREWDLVEVIARRTIEGEGGWAGGDGRSSSAEMEATAVARHKPTNSWAWKALGIVELNKRNYPAAIQALQVALRSDDHDGVCWLRLGEAYIHAGRHAAALKALNRALYLRPDDWMCMYQMGEVQRQTGLLSEAIETFGTVLLTHPKETGVVLALAQTHLSQGRIENASGYSGRAVSSFLTSISTSMDLVEWSPGFRRIAWKTIVDSLLYLATFATFDDHEMVNRVLSRLNKQCAASQADEKIKDISPPVVKPGVELTGVDVLKVAVAICSYRITLFSGEDEGISSARFDYGLALHQYATKVPLEEVRESKTNSAIELVRLALVSEAGNPSYWTAFGNFNFAVHPKIAQHAYIRSLEIDSKDAKVWTNLGLLYLHNNDVELANEALFRAQTLDPDYTMAWVGQGLVATFNGHEDDASALFEHAVSLTADLPEADLEFAYRAFRKMSGSENSSTMVDSLLPSFYSLDRYCRRRTSDPTALHLFGLVCERLGHHELAVEVVSRAIKILETVYEETEDIIIERRYAIANANLARILLTVGKDLEAVETFESAFGLLSADDKNSETTLLRVMCQFGSGIAHFHLGNLEEAMALFETALEVADGNVEVRGQVTVMLSQTLWAIGTDEFREAAKSQLLECIASSPNNLAAVTALAAMGLLTDDEVLIDAALSEIVGLPVEEQLRRDPRHDVETLLTSHYLSEGNIERAQSIFEHSLHSRPSSLIARRKLASLLISLNQAEVAQALLSKLFDASSHLSNRGELHNTARVLAIALAKQFAKPPRDIDALAASSKLAQKAIRLAPWDGQNWRCLAFVQNQVV